MPIDTDRRAVASILASLAAGGIAATNLTAANFLRLTGSGSSNPDFPASGAPMTFGYLSANSNGGGASGIVRTSGIDNWRVSVDAVPLLAASWLCATGLAAMPGRGRASAIQGSDQHCVEGRNPRLLM